MIWENGSSSSQKFSGNWSKTYTGDETKDLIMLSVSGDIMGGDDQTVSCKVIVKRTGEGLEGRLRVHRFGDLRYPAVLNRFRICPVESVAISRAPVRWGIFCFGGR